NQGAFSNTASATTPAAPDTTPPSAPSGLTATAASSSQINLTWTAATDNVGVTGYLVERCQGTGCSTFTQIATPTTTNLSDTGLLASTSYSYRVRARDAANNIGPFSATASATTQGGTVTPAFVQVASSDPQSPQSSVSVTYLSAQTAGNLNVVIVGWNDSTADVNTITDSKGNSYTLAVGPTRITGTLSQSIYYAKNIAAAAAGANAVTITFSPAAQFPDVRILEYSGIDPLFPLDVTAAGTGNSQSTSTPAVTTTAAVELLVAGNMVATLTSGAGPGFTSRVITSPDGDIAEDRVVSAVGSYSASAPLTTAFPGGPWIMQMVAFRGAGQGGDTTPPTAPASLTASAVSSTQVNLSWTASTDNVGVTGYLVERCQGAGCSNFAQIGTSASAAFNDTGALPTTTYGYRVRATDAAGNLSGYSVIASATTPAPPDTTPPTAPSGLTALAVSSTQINLSWTAATDNVGVTSYLIERCQGAGCSTFAQVSTSMATSFSDASLTASASYSYRIRATDAAANLGPFSSTAS
ncbi:MAG TPA: fibronectin type III domain-containing protein, partial [Actinomycetota bacterium]|nr:fibronectin type III domain-containing protein [Actinomycetota bacterium]